MDFTNIAAYNCSVKAVWARFAWLAKKLKAGKAREVRFGRPETALPADFAKIVRKWEAGQLTMQEVTSLCGVSKATFYRGLREFCLTNM